VETLSPQYIKGKTEPVETFKVLSLKEKGHDKPTR
jgi:hypothetical protein